MMTETESSSTMNANLTSLPSTLTTQSSTEAIVETEMITSIEMNTSQISSNQPSSLTTTQASTQTSTGLSTTEQG
jgi:hypothetical protein